MSVLVGINLSFHCSRKKKKKQKKREKKREGGGGGRDFPTATFSHKAHPEICGDECGEDLGHGLLVELVHGHNVEVTQETRCHGVTATTRGTHGSDELNVLEGHLACVLQVIPAVEMRSAPV